MISNLLDRINISSIFVSYLSSLEDYDTKKVANGFLVLFFVVPFITSLVLSITHIAVNWDLSRVLMPTYSLFTGLLFALLLFIFRDASETSSLEVPYLSAMLKLNMLRTVAFEVSYSIALCLFGVFFIVLLNTFSWKYFQLFGSFISFYVLIAFLLNLLMILKSLHKLLVNEFNFQESELKKNRNNTVNSSQNQMP